MTLRWGILATGSICRQFAADLKYVDGATIAAVASRTIANAEDFAHTFGAARFYGNYDALFADPDVDIIYIGTPHPFHEENAIAAMRSGKHVLCEKPLCVTLESARRMIDVSIETGQYLMEAMWTWFLPAIRQAQIWIAEGRIGEIRHIKADFGYPQIYDPVGRMYNPDLGGGALLDMGIYPVAFAWMFHKAMPHAIQVTGRRAPSGVDDDFTAILEYPDHTATLTSSFRCKLQNWATIIGTNGTITIPDFWCAREAYLYENDTCVDHFKDGRKSQGLAFQASVVTQDIAQGLHQPSIVTHADTVGFQEIMAAIQAKI